MVVDRAIDASASHQRFTSLVTSLRTGNFRTRMQHTQHLMQRGSPSGNIGSTGVGAKVVVRKYAAWRPSRYAVRAVQSDRDASSSNGAHPAPQQGPTVQELQQQLAAMQQQMAAMTQLMSMQAQQNQQLLMTVAELSKTVQEQQTQQLQQQMAQLQAAKVVPATSAAEQTAFVQDASTAETIPSATSSPSISESTTASAGKHGASARQEITAKFSKTVSTEAVAPGVAKASPPPPPRTQATPKQLRQVPVVSPPAQQAAAEDRPKPATTPIPVETENTQQSAFSKTAEPPSTTDTEKQAGSVVAVTESVDPAIVSNASYPVAPPPTQPAMPSQPVHEKFDRKGKAGVAGGQQQQQPLSIPVKETFSNGSAAVTGGPSKSHIAPERVQGSLPTTQAAKAPAVTTVGASAAQVKTKPATPAPTAAAGTVAWLVYQLQHGAIRLDPTNRSVSRDLEGHLSRARSSFATSSCTDLVALLSLMTDMKLPFLAVYVGEMCGLLLKDKALLTADNCMAAVIALATLCNDVTQPLSPRVNDQLHNVTFGAIIAQLFSEYVDKSQGVQGSDILSFKHVLHVLAACVHHQPALLHASDGSVSSTVSRLLSVADTGASQAARFTAAGPAQLISFMEDIRTLGIETRTMPAGMLSLLEESIARDMTSLQAADLASFASAMASFAPASSLPDLHTSAAPHLFKPIIASGHGEGHIVSSHKLKWPAEIEACSSDRMQEMSLEQAALIVDAFNRVSHVPSQKWVAALQACTVYHLPETALLPKTTTAKQFTVPLKSAHSGNVPTTPKSEPSVNVSPEVCQALASCVVMTSHKVDAAWLAGMTAALEGNHAAYTAGQLVDTLWALCAMGAHPAANVFNSLASKPGRASSLTPVQVIRSALLPSYMSAITGPSAPQLNIKWWEEVQAAALELVQQPHTQDSISSAVAAVGVHGEIVRLLAESAAAAGKLHVRGAAAKDAKGSSKAATRQQQLSSSYVITLVNALCQASDDMGCAELQRVTGLVHQLIDLDLSGEALPAIQSSVASLLSRLEEALVVLGDHQDDVTGESAGDAATSTAHHASSATTTTNAKHKQHRINETEAQQQVLAAARLMAKYDMEVGPGLLQALNSQFSHCPAGSLSDTTMATLLCAVMSSKDALDQLDSEWVESHAAQLNSISYYRAASPVELIRTMSALLETRSRPSHELCTAMLNRVLPHVSSLNDKQLLEFMQVCLYCQLRVSDSKQYQQVQDRLLRVGPGLSNSNLVLAVQACLTMDESTTSFTSAPDKKHKKTHGREAVVRMLDERLTPIAMEHQASKSSNKATHPQTTQDSKVDTSAITAESQQVHSSDQVFESVCPGRMSSDIWIAAMQLISVFSPDWDENKTRAYVACLQPDLQNMPATQLSALLYHCARMQYIPDLQFWKDFSAAWVNQASTADPAILLRVLDQLVLHDDVLQATPAVKSIINATCMPLSVLLNQAVPWDASKQPIFAVRELAMLATAFLRLRKGQLMLRVLDLVPVTVTLELQGVEAVCPDLYPTRPADVFGVFMLVLQTLEIEEEQEDLVKQLQATSAFSGLVTPQATASSTPLSVADIRLQERLHRVLDALTMWIKSHQLMQDPNVALPYLRACHVYTLKPHEGVFSELLATVVQYLAKNSPMPPVLRTLPGIVELTEMMYPPAEDGQISSKLGMTIQAVLLYVLSDYKQIMSLPLKDVVLLLKQMATYSDALNLGAAEKLSISSVAVSTMAHHLKDNDGSANYYDAYRVLLRSLSRIIGPEHARGYATALAHPVASILVGTPVAGPDDVKADLEQAYIQPMLDVLDAQNLGKRGKKRGTEFGRDTSKTERNPEDGVRSYMGGVAQEAAEALPALKEPELKVHPDLLIAVLQECATLSGLLSDGRLWSALDTSVQASMGFQRSQEGDKAVLTSHWSLLNLNAFLVIMHQAAYQPTAEFLQNADALGVVLLRSPDASLTFSATLLKNLAALGHTPSDALMATFFEQSSVQLADIAAGTGTDVVDASTAGIDSRHVALLSVGMALSAVPVALTEDWMISYAKTVQQCCGDMPDTLLTQLGAVVGQLMFDNAHLQSCGPIMTAVDAMADELDSRLQGLSQEQGTGSDVRMKNMQATKKALKQASSMDTSAA